MNRNPFLEQLADSHEAQIKKTLENLEADIISGISKATNDDNILTTKISIDLRKDLKRYMEQYRIDTDTLVRDYDQIVNSFMEEFGQLNIPDKFKSLTEVDLLTINQLKFQSFSGFEEIANRYLTEISANVYQNAIAGKPFNEMVKDIRGLITGDVDRRGRSMSTYASQIAHDSVMQFDGQFTVFKAKEAGLDKYKYTGTLVRDSRDHCKIHVGKTYTEERIREIWQGSWAGKSEGDAFIVRGGYRCRHTWIPVVEVEEDDIPEIPEQEVSLSNRIKADRLTPITHSALINSLNNGFKESAKDSRYIRYSTTKEPVRKFTGKIDDYGVANIKAKETRRKTRYGRLISTNKYEYSDRDFAAINVLTKEINELCKKYNVQNIRGYKSISRKNVIADMGDGVMGLNIKFLRLDGQTITTKSQWKFGDSVNSKPFSSSAYFDDPLDKIRSTFYHELGHHIHQQKFVKNVDDYMSPLIEKKMLGKIINNKSATKYANKNQKEWFAENFALYHMDRKDIVDPDFIKFLKEVVID